MTPPDILKAQIGPLGKALSVTDGPKRLRQAESVEEGNKSWIMKKETNAE
jgi:hypothetical protein